MDDSVAAILSRMDHWAALDLGASWQRAAEALHDTSSASKAFTWARFCYLQYQKAWESSPASRWDPDALAEIQVVDALLAQLYARPAEVEPALPPWVTELLSGILPEAVIPTPGLEELAAIAEQLRLKR